MLLKCLLASGFICDCEGFEALKGHKSRAMHKVGVFAHDAPSFPFNLITFLSVGPGLCYLHVPGRLISG